ncbi:MAG: FlgD immunoglobulin-like domain containing protein, partial [bacterium]
VGASTPTPFYGASLAFDGYGDDPKDWYIDETPSFGRPDHTVPGTVERSLYYPAGTQDFEAVLLGDEIIAVEDWGILDESAVRGIFTARVVDDVMGAVDPRGMSTRWLRIRDQNPHGMKDGVVTPVISGMEPSDYQWSFYVALEERPGGGDTCPAIMVQHAALAFEPTWGIELHDDAWYLAVTEVGGDADKARLTMRRPALGQWVHVQIAASLENSTVRVVIDGTNAGELPIDLDARADAAKYRLAYQGNGEGNTGTLLLDDLSLEASSSVMPLFAAFTAQAIGGTAALSWEIRDGETVDGFAVYRRAGDTAEALIAASLPPNARRYEDIDVVPGTEYRYQIGAVSPDGTIVRSRAATVSVNAAPAVVFGDINAHARNGVVELTWDIRASESIAGFRVSRRSGVMATETDATDGTLLPGDARRFEDMDVSSGAWYDYRLTAVTVSGAEIRSRSSTIHVPTPPLEVSQVFPNPFRNSTSLEFTLPATGPVTVRIYDVRGQLVATLNDGVRPAGTHRITWNGRDDNGSRVSAGTYFFKFEAERVVSTRKVVLVR